ncbi:hypothetical protein C8J56DRAFT_1139648 [Mycena floridula]|nr:hypothetical protein C8J56DRAFT_1139648 [Mycena floridula]
MFYSTSTVVAVAVIALRAGNTFAAPTGTGSTLIQARGYDSELETRGVYRRDFDDLQLEARNPIKNLYNNAKDKVTGMTKAERKASRAAKKAAKAGGAAPGAATPDATAVEPGTQTSRRDFDEFELEARDYDNYELEGRDFAELDARWSPLDVFRSKEAVAKRKQKSADVAKVRAGIPIDSPSGTAAPSSSRRDFAEFELEARNLYDFGDISSRGFYELEDLD